MKCLLVSKSFQKVTEENYVKPQINSCRITKNGPIFERAVFPMSGV
jgi:hypothetical protein